MKHQSSTLYPDSPVRFRAQPPLKNEAVAQKLPKRPAILAGRLLPASPEITAKLRENRDWVAAFYGPRWPFERGTYEPMLRTAMSIDGLPVLAEAQKLAKTAIDEGMGLLAAVFLAVAVEIMEGGVE